ncbi:MAG: SAM-dependent methyltransferase [Anaerolineae bacterium]|nr:SAM-dependent methyltransferase [Anaerolineae bacterium]
MNRVTVIAEAVKEYLTTPAHSSLVELISSYSDFEQANKRLKALTGIRSFFSDQKTWAEFRQVLASPVEGEETLQEREWGDFQTPPRLVDQVCRYLAKLPISPQVIIEPTYGLGNFILGALKYFPAAKLMYGVEIQQKYEWQLKLNLLTEAMQGSRPITEIELHQDDIFTHQFSPEVLNAPDLLIIGNPPWITNAELGGLNSRNLPPKRNLKALNGLDALTGKSNFDLGEAVLLRLLKLFSYRRGTLALLCKNAVIKNIVKILPEQLFHISNIRALEINAAREFSAAVDASLLVLEMGQPTTFVCKVATLNRPTDIIKSFGWTHHQFVSNIESYETTSELDGASPFLWRHGLKHDCAKIMELDGQNGTYTNGNNEIVDIEPEAAYWLLKSSDLRSFESAQARKKVIVTQHFLGEDTAALKQRFPKLWGYLTKNSEYFARRKSKIYRDKPRFSIFGVGEYSFKPYKVAVSGL